MIENIGKSVVQQEQEKLESELKVLVDMSRVNMTGIQKLAECAVYDSLD